MSDVKIAYETYGRLAADGRNAILMSPGFTTSHRFVGNQELMRRPLALDRSGESHPDG